MTADDIPEDDAFDPEHDINIPWIYNWPKHFWNLFPKRKQVVPPVRDFRDDDPKPVPQEEIDEIPDTLTERKAVDAHNEHEKFDYQD